MKSRRSINSALRYFQVRMAMLMVLVIVFFLSINIWNSMTYSRFFYAYQDLQDVFSESEEAVNAIKSYLANGSTDDLNRYHTSLASANRSVSHLQDNPVVTEKWRLDLLSNSLSALDDSGRTLIVIYQDPEKASSYQDSYEEFLHRQDLISQTATSYYHLLTQSMSSKMQSLTLLSNATIILSVCAALMLLTLITRLNGFFTRNVVSPLENIFDNIRRIQNRQYELIPPRTDSQEIADLYLSLEELASRVESGMEMEKRNADLEKKLAQSEVRMLQNQINPHFLFNTLNTIYCMAEADGAHKAADMLIKTSHLLRYGLDMQNRISTLDDELKAAGSYVEIQTIRLQDKVDFSWDVSLSTETGFLPIPGMILQPLMENSIKHGLKDCLQGGKLCVSIQEQNGPSANGEDITIIISVWDNGKGMDPKSLKEMIDSDFQNTESNGFGLYNVVHRLKAYYQDRVQIEFFSEPGNGFRTTIQICCPLVLLQTPMLRNAGDIHDPSSDCGR